MMSHVMDNNQPVPKISMDKLASWPAPNSACGGDQHQGALNDIREVYRNGGRHTKLGIIEISDMDHRHDLNQSMRAVDDAAGKDRDDLHGTLGDHSASQASGNASRHQ